MADRGTHCGGAGEVIPGESVVVHVRLDGEAVFVLFVVVGLALGEAQVGSFREYDRSVVPSPVALGFRVVRAEPPG